MENMKTQQAIFKDLNAIVLGAMREVAEMEDGYHQLAIQFGISKETADALKKLSLAEMWEVVEKMSGTFLFAARNVDSTLYQLVRNNVPQNDVALLTKLRATAASKVARV